MTPFAIAGIQMQVHAGRNNIEAMGQRLAVLMARFPWVQMVVFSELAPFGPLLGNAQELPGPAEDAFRALAQRYDVWLLPGSMFERTERGIFNTASVIDPRGNVVGRYRKMFPFRPYEEGVEAGTEHLLFDVPEVGRFGVSICYDMWFPETSRTLACLGAEVILHPTMTDTIDRDVEISIARATAVTNQCYFVDINGVGDGGVGRSIIVGPSGYVIHEARGNEESIPVEIDLDRVRREREVGIRSLGQPLKSFRDRPVDCPVYRRDAQSQAYLQSLGPLAKPLRGSRAGLRAAHDVVEAVRTGEHTIAAGPVAPSAQPYEATLASEHAPHAAPAAPNQGG